MGCLEGAEEQKDAVRLRWCRERIVMVSVDGQLLIENEVK